MTNKSYGSPKIAWFYSLAAGTGAYFVTQQVPVAIIVAAILIILFKIRK